ncbi:MAG TPA: 50S ribosomal protein L40e [Candidatus Nanoarchaeia archaeon]|nr:50S ribosomal protein L40e [Candidatus Nanoarchaeia archaeon]
MAKFQEANIRLFRNIFVCKRCKTKIRAPNIKVVAGKIKCRKCNAKELRPKRKK